MMERVMGIEPTSSAWEAEVLPLNYTRRAGRAGPASVADPASGQDSSPFPGPVNPTSWSGTHEMEGCPRPLAEQGIRRG